MERLLQDYSLNNASVTSQNINPETSMEDQTTISENVDIANPTEMAIGSLGITGIASGLSGVQQNIGQNTINANQRATGSVSTTKCKSTDKQCY